MEIVTSFAIFEKMLHKEKSIRAALDNNFCVFRYIKKSGEKRKAFGTLKNDFIKKRWTPSGNESPSIDSLRLRGYIQYWDIERNNFRQFTMDDGVELIEEFETAEALGDAYPELRTKLGLPKFSKNKKEVEDKADDENSEETQKDTKN